MIMIIKIDSKFSFVDATKVLLDLQLDTTLLIYSSLAKTVN